MKVKTINLKRNGWNYGLEIQVNDKTRLIICEGEPEDMIMGRNLNDCYYIPDLILEAYEAGKRGEELKIEETEED